MTATIASICVGLPKDVEHNGKTVSTAIWKNPVAGKVRVSLTNIDGDGQADPRVHGGPDKAVYAYPQKHYATWARELGRDELEPAQFGENLTVTELDESNVTLGARYRAGSVEMLVAQPRLPCAKLGLRIGDDSFPQRLLASGRLGFYLRVETEGRFAAGDTFEFIDRPDHGITVEHLWQQLVSKTIDAAEIERCLALLPYLDAGWRRRLRARLSNAG